MLTVIATYMPAEHTLQEHNELMPVDSASPQIDRLSCCFDPGI